MKKFSQFYLKHCIITGFILVFTALFFRLMDIFVLGLDLLWGEILLSKSIGTMIVFGFIFLSRDKKWFKYWKWTNMKPIIAFGVIVTVFLLAVGYVTEYVVFFERGLQLKIAGIDPKTGKDGAILFALFLLFGNVVNCFMEEGLFRAILIPLFKQRMSTRSAILLQGILFGLWHLPWAFRWLQTGMIEGTSGLIYGVMINTLPMLFMGIVFGVMFHYSGSVWASWLSHFIINSILNLLHINSQGNTDPYIVIRMAVFQTIIFTSIPLLIRYSKNKSKEQVSN